MSDYTAANIRILDQGKINLRWKWANAAQLAEQFKRSPERHAEAEAMKTCGKYGQKTEATPQLRKKQAGNWRERHA